MAPRRPRPCGRPASTSRRCRAGSRAPGPAHRGRRGWHRRRQAARAPPGSPSRQPCAGTRRPCPARDPRRRSAPGDSGPAGLHQPEIQEPFDQALEAAGFVGQELVRALALLFGRQAALDQHAGQLPHRGERAAELVRDRGHEIRLQPRHRQLPRHGHAMKQLVTARSSARTERPASSRRRRAAIPRRRAAGRRPTRERPGQRGDGGGSHRHALGWPRQRAEDRLAPGVGERQADPRVADRLIPQRRRSCGPATPAAGAWASRARQRARSAESRLKRSPAA